MKKCSKKLFSMMLIVCMAICMLVGCGNEKDNETKTPNQSEKENTSSVDSSESEEKVDYSDVTLKYYLFGSTNPDDDAVYEKAKEIVRDKLGCNIEIIVVESGEYASKMQVLSAANEPFDVVFTSNWANSYYDNVYDGNFVALDDLLDTVPDLVDMMPEYYWTGATVDGKIYAVPNQQIAARAPGLMIPTRNIELLNLDASDYNIKDCTDYLEYLKIVENYLVALNEVTGTYATAKELWSEGVQIFGFETLVSTKNPGAVMYNSEEPLKVVNQYKSQEFVDYIKARREWQQKGLVQPEVTNTRELETFIESEGAIPSLEVIGTYKPGVEQEVSDTSGYPCTMLVNTTPYLTTGATISTMNAVSATSEYPELALKFIELLNTDKELYNLLSFGIEGLNYAKLGENTIVTSSNNRYYQPNWAIGCVYNSYLYEAQDEDIWEETKEINDSSINSPLLGFSPNLENIQVEIAGCTAVVEEYYSMLVYGVVDVDEVYPEFIEKLDAAGVDKIISELQSQIDAWLAE